MCWLTGWWSFSAGRHYHCSSIHIIHCMGVAFIYCHYIPKEFHLKQSFPPPPPIIINISLVNAINMKWNQVSQKDLILHVFKWFALGRGEKMTIASWAQISAEYKRKKSKSVGSFYSIRDGWHRLSFFTWFYSIGKQVLVLQWGREKISREIDRKKEEKKWWL